MFGLLHRSHATLDAMLRHNLVHMRDLLIGEFATLILFGTFFFGLLLWLRHIGSYRFRIRNGVVKPKQAVRETVNTTRALFIYNGSQLLSRIGILALGFVLTFDHPLPLWEALLTYPLVLIAHDTYFFWTHWLMHRPALFKFMHWEHHRSLQPSVFTAYSFSLSESVVQGMFPIFYVALLPCDFSTLIFFYIVMIAHDAAVHSGIDIFPRWAVVGRFGWICGAAHHDMHHALGRTNYGLYFRFWDVVMKTEHPDFEKVYDYIHSPQNDGLAYRKLLGRSAPDTAVETPAAEPAS